MKKIIKITQNLSFDEKRQIILWKNSVLRYRVALIVLPLSEQKALCSFFNSSVDQLEARFQLI